MYFYRPKHHCADCTEKLHQQFKEQLGGMVAAYLWWCHDLTHGVDCMAE